MFKNLEDEIKKYTVKVSRVMQGCFCFPFLHSAISLENSYHLPSQSDAKLLASLPLNFHALERV